MGNHLVANRFELVRKVGKGSFGDVYIGRDKTNQEEVAMKFEPICSRPQRLNLEKNFYQKLHGALGVPHVMWYGTCGDYNILVMDLLGPSLEDLFRHCSKIFSLKTVLMLADQMLCRMEHVHRQGVVHRDIKPDNFLMGVGKNSHMVYLVDFGLAIDYCRSSGCKNGSQPRRTRGLTGTARYASINAHQGCDQSPRDDLEALLYTLVYFLKGELPWQHMKAENDKQRADRIAEIKMSTPLDIICEGIPVEFRECLQYCRGLAYGQEPNYLNIRQNLMHLFAKVNHFLFDYKYDWTLMSGK